MDKTSIFALEEINLYDCKIMLIKNYDHVLTTCQLQLSWFSHLSYPATRFPSTLGLCYMDTCSTCRFHLRRK